MNLYRAVLIYLQISQFQYSIAIIFLLKFSIKIDTFANHNYIRLLIRICFRSERKILSCTINNIVFFQLCDFNIFNENQKFEVAEMRFLRLFILWNKKKEVAT